MIVAEHVTKYYGPVPAVSDLSFTIDKGEVVGLLGLNGAGKTTTLQILSGLLVPTSGSVHIAGLDMAEEPEAVRARIGFLPEKPPLYHEMIVEDYLRFVARIKGIRRNLDEAIDRSLTATDMQSRRDQRIGTLSYGQLRRVGIAQAVVHQPSLILLDEPTSGLDPVQVVHMRQLIRNLRERHTVMVSSHILHEIHEVCDRILVLHEGRIAAQGREEELAGTVSGTTTVAIEVRGTADALGKAVEKVGDLVGHQVDRQDNGLVAATVEFKQDRREELARAVVEAGMGLMRLQLVEVELESIFLRLTGGQAPATGAKEAGR